MTNPPTRYARCGSSAGARAPLREGTVERPRFHDWLDPDRGEKDDRMSLLVPAAPGRLEAYPVSTEINNVRNNGPQLLDPIGLET